MTLSKIRDLMLEITPNAYHYKAWEQPDTYIVWAEDSESDSIHADNKKQILLVDVTIDVYSKNEYDPIVLAVKEKLNEKEIPFRMLSIQYEEGTGYIHYEFLIQGAI